MFAILLYLNFIETGVSIQYEFINKKSFKALATRRRLHGTWIMCGLCLKEPIEKRLMFYLSFADLQAEQMLDRIVSQITDTHVFLCAPFLT